MQRQARHGGILVQELALVSIEACLVFSVVPTELHFDAGYPGNPERSGCDWESTVHGTAAAAAAAAAGRRANIETKKASRRAS